MNQSDRQLEEFITRLKRIEGEMQLLQEEKKDLFNEYDIDNILNFNFVLSRQELNLVTL